MSLADGTTLLHIGPYKTGTTAMQAALWHSREALAEHGVHYFGARGHEMEAAMAVAAGGVGAGNDLEAMRSRWHMLLAELRAKDPRIGVLSSEVYCEATDDGAREVLDAIGPDVRVLITLRPIVRLMGSQWQQYAQNIAVPPYDEWLHGMLDEPEAARFTPSFWRRHRHDALVERWVGLVGADRVTVVVVDDRDHDGLPRTFEDLLGVPHGLLEVPDDRSNRSLTFPETALVQELVRRTVSPAWDRSDHTRFIRFGAARGVQAVPADRSAERVLTPAWAIERGLEIGATIAEGVAASGAEIIGDLGLLHDPALAPAEGVNRPVDAVDPEIVAALVGGLVSKMSGVRGKPEPRANAGRVERALWSRHRAVVEARRGEVDQTQPAESVATAGGLKGLAARVRRRLGG